MPLLLLRKPARDHIPHEPDHHDEQHRRRDLPEVGVAVKLHAVEPVEVHAEISGQEGERQEEDGDDGELLHALVLQAADGVEDEVDHRVGRVPHLVEVVGHEHDVVLDIADVDLRDGADVDDGCARFGVRAVVEGVAGGNGFGFVVAERVEEVDDGVDGVAELRDFAGEDV